MAQDYKEKIRKLLALAESPNEHEARSALLKARKLMAEHKLSEADVKGSKKSQIKRVDTQICFSKRKNHWIYSLSAIIGENYCCQAFRIHKKGKQTQEIGFIGFEEDVNVCVELFRYTVDCVLAEQKRIKKQMRDVDAAQKMRICNSFGYGFNAGLEAAFLEQQIQNESEWGLVLSTPKEVLEATASFGRQPFKIRVQTTVSAEAYQHGYESGLQFQKEKRLTNQEK